MKISVCVDAVFAKYDLIESMRALKELGVDTIEFWAWWEKDTKKIKECMDELGMKVATFCTSFISLTDVSKQEAYIEGLKASIEAAKHLDCKMLISQVGNDTGQAREVQHNNIVEGLKKCVSLLEESGITLVIEPLNTHVDHKGYYLTSSQEAFDIVHEVGSKNVKVLYDIYHQSVTRDSGAKEGDIIETIINNIDKIGHFHAAGSPGRGELHTGNLDYKNVFSAIEMSDYQGLVGYEYFLDKDPIKGLKLFI